MTDKEKLDKLVAEIERRIAFFNEQSARKITTDDNSCALALQGVLGFYDSMQKESKECMYSKDNYTDEDRKVLCDSCEEECKFNKKEEHVSIWHDASKETPAQGQTSSRLDGRNWGYYNGFCYNEIEPPFKWAYVDDLLNLSNFERTVKDWKEDSVSDSFEAEVKELWEEINTGHSYSIVDSYNIFYGLCMDIADWQKEQQNIIEPTGEGQVKESLISKHEDKTCKENGNSLTQEPVSEDFEKEIDSYFAKWLQGASDEGCFNPDSQLVSIYDCHRIARHFANWQKQKMLAKAVNATVHIDAGGYPYIPQMELYNYEKDIPFAKEGDKYKVILIKE